MAVDGHLNFDTIIKTGGFQKGLKNIGNTLSSLKGTVMNLAGAFGIAFSTAALVNFSKSAKEAYNVQLEGETKLATVLGEHLDATEEQIQATKDYASALQEIGVIGDEVQLAGLQELSTYIENPESLKTMNGVLTDMLAQQYGLNASAESAVTISTMLGKVLAGQTSALSRYGYTFDEAQEQLLKYGTEEQRVATLADVVLDSVGGMNEALAQTPAGRMKQLENTMGDIKERFGEAVTQIEVLLLPALKQVANALQFIADKANEVTQALSEVFGTKSNKAVSTTGTGEIDSDLTDSLTDSTEALSDEAEDTADSYEDMAKAAEDANKANNEDLANFDKLNVKAKETADSTEDYADSKTKAAAEKAVEEALDEAADGIEKSVTFDVEADTDEAESALTKLIKNIKNSIETLFEPIKKSWEQYGEAVVESVKNKFTSIKNLISSIGKTFGEVWTNGTGERIVGNILNIFTNINDTITKLSDNFKTAWDSGVGLSIVQKLADTFNTVLEHINNISKKTSEWSANVNFEPILTAFDKLLTPIQKIVDIAGTWAENVWEKIFLPLAGWAIEEGVPAALEVIGGFLDLVAAIGATVGDALAYIWDNFLSKLVSWVGNGIVNFLEVFGKFLSDVAENQTAVTTLLAVSEVIGTIVIAIISITTILKSLPTIMSAIPGILSAIGNPIIWIIIALVAIGVVIVELVTYWDTFKEGLFKGVEGIKNSFKKFAGWFKNGWIQFANWWTDKVTNIWNGLKDGAKNAWEGIKSVFGKAADFFGNVFSNAWSKVKEVFNKGGAIFTGIKDGIFESFKKIVNSLIDAINSVVRVPFDGINFALDGIRNVEIAGWKPFEWLPAIDIPQIPHLATGMVVPANYGEFAAILGDNKRETEVVSPVSAIEQAVENVLNRRGITSGLGSDIVVPIEIDGREVFRAVKRVNDAQKRRHGGRSQLA